jgi:WD repeat-containing protein 24
VTCGSCRQSVSKGQCKCNLLCVLCEERLNKKLVIWCKYCGHGGHAVEYEKWFKDDKNKLCPHGCGHACFTTGEMY